MTYPVIIQGGMGAGVSDWRLAQAVSREGQLGVVSGTALDLIFARRLQLGDPGGHMARAIASFPDQGLARRVYDRYYVSGGKAPDAPFESVPVFTATPRQDLLELCVLANYAEVTLAKEGHDGPVGVNHLAKIQLPVPSALYGAMLAGVDYVIVGAGIPREVPGVLDCLTRHEAVSMRLHVEGASRDDNYRLHFRPKEVLPLDLPDLKRPRFLAIVSSDTLATALARKSTGTIDGFVVEGSTAGGHNAPPRGKLTLSATGQPVYGARDLPKLDRIKELGLPFWLAGSHGHPDKLAKALELGATGVQVGTAFAFCEESGLAPDLKRRFLAKSAAGEAKVFTDPQASPTGFPFKVGRLEGTLSEEEVYNARTRLCDLGFLRSIYKRDDGTLGYRCPAEPEAAYVRKAGLESDTVGRKCLCNALMANISLAQYQRSDDYLEKPLVTVGDDLKDVADLVVGDSQTYTARDVLNYLLG